MIVLHVDLETGYQKANTDNLPRISMEKVVKFLATAAADNKLNGQEDNSAITDDSTVVDYVQLKHVGAETELRAIVFHNVLAAADEDKIHYACVSLTVQTDSNTILKANCEHCQSEQLCAHINAFVFFLHRTTYSLSHIKEFWGADVAVRTQEAMPELLRDQFAPDELRAECDLELAAVSEQEGNNFLEAVLDEMECLGQTDAEFFRHCRPIESEFEALFVHHTMLDASNHNIKDAVSCVQYFDEQSKTGLFDRLADVTRNSYKSDLYLEAQYMRLRCSLIHSIVSRKGPEDDEVIFRSLFCEKRTLDRETKQQLKQHKRFILKQTEKLENKTYEESGLLICESYPFLCASPDGYTDDHIVEIKAPKTEQQFERYLAGRETIAAKYMAQIQIQMYVANVTKALYCVLSPSFDSTGALHYVWVQADMEYVANLLRAADAYWKDVVFPRLLDVYMPNC